MTNPEVSTVPTYHWSEIASPRWRELRLSLLSDPISVTQKVHGRNETPKTTKARAAFVTYDSDFVKYKLLEAVAPFLTEYFQETEIDEISLEVKDDVNDVVTQPLLRELNDAIVSAVNTHVQHVRACREIGVELDFEPSSILRSFKIEAERNYKLAQVRKRLQSSSHIANNSEVAACSDPDVREESLSENIATLD